LTQDPRQSPHLKYQGFRHHVQNLLSEIADLPFGFPEKPRSSRYGMRKSEVTSEGDSITEPARLSLFLSDPDGMLFAGQSAGKQPMKLDSIYWT
jgi:hypothetical protein